jgi:hypothetical protein
MVLFKGRFIALNHHIRGEKTMNNQLRNYKKWIFIVVVLVGGILYIGSSLMNKDDESAFKENDNDVHIWSSTSPEFVMSETEAETNINNIKAMQKEGWKLFVQDGQPISFHSEVSGRNEILEKSASSLLQGGYEISIDTEGNIVDIKVSEDAKMLLEEQQKQVQAEKDKQEQAEQQNEHDIKFNVIQNNI